MNKTSKTSVVQLMFYAGQTENERLWAEVTWSGKGWIFGLFLFKIIQKGKMGEKKIYIKQAGQIKSTN